MNKARSLLAPLTFALASVLAPRGASAEADAPPCEETACGGSCEDSAAAFGLSQNQPPKPPIGAQARCIEVSLPTAADPCVFEKHPACDCAASSTPQGGNVVIQGLPEFGIQGDAPSDACTRAGFLPNSCLLHGSETHCDLAGDGADCTAVCDLLRTRMVDEAARASGVTVSSSRCAAPTVCACVFNLDGECSFANEAVDCGTDASTAYNQWLVREQAKPIEKACFQGGCAACVASGDGSGGSDAGAILAACLGGALFVARRRRLAR